LLTNLVRQVIAEQTVARDDMRVLTAIAMRQDNTLAALLTEVRGMHSQHSRIDSRLRALESKAG
jgi:predicted DNA-binding ribbon-helix-helix protein